MERERWSYWACTRGSLGKMMLRSRREREPGWLVPPLAGRVQPGETRGALASCRPRPQGGWTPDVAVPVPCRNIVTFCMRTRGVAGGDSGDPAIPWLPAAPGRQPVPTGVACAPHCPFRPHRRLTAPTRPGRRTPLVHGHLPPRSRRARDVLWPPHAVPNLPECRQAGRPCSGVPRSVRAARVRGQPGRIPLEPRSSWRIQLSNRNCRSPHPRRRRGS